MKRKKIEGYRIPIDELLPEAEAIALPPIKKILRKEPLYRVAKQKNN
ncbi:hypothetical protein [Phormidesmis sp. 146-33]